MNILLTLLLTYKYMKTHIIMHLVSFLDPPPNVEGGSGNETSTHWNI